MRTLHLKKIGDTWHYQRRRPKAFKDVEPRSLIRFSLKTKNYAEARAIAAKTSLELDHKWESAKRRGISLSALDQADQYAAAVDTASEFELSYAQPSQIDDEALLQRLRLLLEQSPTAEEQKAVLGLFEEPVLALGAAFDRFWEHIRDEWLVLSKDQQRVKRNIYLKAIRNFENAAGAVPLHEIKRENALTFRSWWLARVEKEGLKPYTANREINSLRRLVSVNFDIDGIERVNPFHRVRLKDTKDRQRKPFTSEFIQSQFLAPGKLDGLKPELSILVRMLINTGARPSELIGLELADVDLAAEIPFIHIRKNGTRSLKTDHSERQIPLLGASLIAAHEFVELGGWGKWQGKNMYATSQINKYFRERELVTDKNQSLYSLRHWFQDQLTKNDVIDRAQAQLMGHKFQRPKYGFGKDLTELHAIIAKFAL